MTFDPVALRKSASPSTMSLPTTCEYGGAPPPGIVAGAHVQLSTSSAPRRITVGPKRLKRAINGAFFPVNDPFVICVFSKLKPANPCPICPAAMARLTVTVPGRVAPEKGGPPSTGVPQPASMDPAPASPKGDPCGASPEELPDDDPPAGPEELPEDDPGDEPEELPDDADDEPPDDPDAEVPDDPLDPADEPDDDAPDDPDEPGDPPEEDAPDGAAPEEGELDPAPADEPDEDDGPDAEPLDEDDPAPLAFGVEDEVPQALASAASREAGGRRRAHDRLRMVMALHQEKKTTCRRGTHGPAMGMCSLGHPEAQVRRGASPAPPREGSQSLRFRAAQRQDRSSD